SLDDVLDDVAGLGFNLLRVPWSSAMVRAPQAGGVSHRHNPDLIGLTPLELLDVVIDRAGQRGLYVLLDRHSLDVRDHRTSDLWYDAATPESVLIEDWRMLAERYRGVRHVIGADIHNEPAGIATWGTGDPAT